MIDVAEGYNKTDLKQKILRQTNYPFGTIAFKPKLNICDRYFAIDTSYKKYGENFLCVCACLSIEQDINPTGKINKGDQIILLQWPRLVFLAKLDTKPERYGWMRYIKALINGKTFLNDRSYGIIVDSDLNEIPKINSYETTICEDFYLPKNMSLIYASADTGMENLQNKLIKQTDKIAAQTLHSIKDEFKQFESKEIDKNFFDLKVITGKIEVIL